MPRFMFLYRATLKEAGSVSPEQAQQSMSQWMGWIGEGMQTGWMLSAGEPLHRTGRVVSGDTTATEGPFAETTEVVGGFGIVQADDYDAAVELTKGCPIYNEGGVVEVREIMEIG